MHETLALNQVRRRGYLISRTMDRIVDTERQEIIINTIHCITLKVFLNFTSIEKKKVSIKI